MKTKLNCFLQMINADLAIEENNFEKIKTIIEKNCGITITEKDHTLNFYSTLIYHEIWRCKEEFHNKLCTYRREDKIDEYVNATHLCLDSLKKRILLKTGEEEKHKVFDFKQSISAKSIFQLMYLGLDQYQSYLEKVYSDQIKPGNNVSTDYLNSTINGLFDIVQKVINHFKENNIDHQLTDMFMYPTQRLINFEEGKRIKLHDIIYYKKFLSVFHELVIERGEGITDKDIRDTFFFMNFNSPKFYAYAVKYIKRDLINCQSFSQEVNKIYDYLKETQCCPLKSLEPFLPDRECINIMLFDFCKVELNHFQTLGLHGAEFLKKREEELAERIQNEEPIDEENKMLWNGTAVMLGGWMKGMKNTGLIKSKSLRQTYRSTAKFFRTVRKDEVSEEVLRKKSYALPEKERKEILKKLDAMTKYFNDPPKE